MPCFWGLIWGGSCQVFWVGLGVASTLTSKGAADVLGILGDWTLAEDAFDIAGAVQHSVDCQWV